MNKYYISVNCVYTVLYLEKYLNNEDILQFIDVCENDERLIAEMLVEEMHSTDAGMLSGSTVIIISDDNEEEIQRFKSKDLSLNQISFERENIFEEESLKGALVFEDYNDFYYELGSFEVEDETFQLEKTKLTIKNYYYNSDTRIKNNTDDDSNLWGGLLQEFSYGDLEFDLEIIDYEAANLGGSFYYFNDNNETSIFEITDEEFLNKLKKTIQ